MDKGSDARESLRCLRPSVVEAEVTGGGSKGQQMDSGEETGTQFLQTLLGSDVDSKIYLSPFPGSQEGNKRKRGS